MKKHPFNEIAWALREPETEKLKVYAENPEELVGRTLHVSHGIGEPTSTELVLSVSPKRVFTENFSYWIESGFQVRGGNSHAKVIVRKEAPANATPENEQKEPNPCRYGSHEWHEWETSHE